MRFPRIFLLPTLIAFLSFYGPQAFAALRAAEECGTPIYNIGREPCAGAFDGVVTQWSPGDACARMVEEGGSLSCSRVVYPGDPVFRPDGVVGLMGPPNVPYCVHTVRRPRRAEKWGIERYAECEIRKTRVELDAFIEQTARTLPVYGSLYVSNKWLIAKLTQNANAIACLVKNWDGNPRYTDMVAEMKNNFKALTNQEYSEAACRIDAPESVTCAADDNTEVCQAQRSVDTARDFLKAGLDEVNLLMGDVVPASEPAYRLRLESFAAEFAEYMKK